MQDAGGRGDPPAHRQEHLAHNAQKTTQLKKSKKRRHRSFLSGKEEKRSSSASGRFAAENAGQSPNSLEEGEFSSRNRERRRRSGRRCQAAEPILVDRGEEFGWS